jgi:acetate kinase
MAAVMASEGDDRILAVNSGSSSLKLGLFIERKGEEQAFLEGGADGIGTPSGRLRVKDAEGKVLLDESYRLSSQGEALEQILQAVLKFAGGMPCAVGHRIVHGGPHLREHQLITEDLIHALQAAVHFAPLHIPASIALIEVTKRLLPHARQFACFDTAFHTTMPETAYRFALPENFDQEGVRKYGFHGLSYESIVHRLGANIPARVVCAHLGSGASLVALRDGRSIDTSMGLTPTGGIPMATRSGDLDPGVLLFLMRNSGAGANELEKMLNRKSGMGALSGGETDMRTLLDRMNSGDPKAKLAVDIFCNAVRKCVGAYAAELGGLDLLIFTGGIGEHSLEVRQRVCAGLEFLGIARVDAGQLAKVTAMNSEEEIQIARHCRRMMAVQ